MVVGAHNVDVKEAKNETTQKRYNIQRYVVHEKYLKEKPSYDIALIQLDSPMKYNKVVRPICVDATEVPYKTRCIVTGWGITSVKGQIIQSCINISL